MPKLIHIWDFFGTWPVPALNKVFGTFKLLNFKTFFDTGR